MLYSALKMAALHGKGSVITDNAPERAIDRIRLYVDHPYTSPDTLVLDSDLVRITAQDLADLVALCDEMKAHNRFLSGEYDVVLAGRADEYDRAEKAETEVERLRVLEAENARLRSALSIYADFVSDYASDCELASDPAYDWLQEDGGGG